MAKTAKDKPKADAPLTDKQEMFCREFIVDLNGTQAAIRAGYSEKTANEQASQLLAKLSVQSRVAQLKAERAQRLGVSADQVLQWWVDIATADPNDLIQLRRGCCRHCHGDEFQYQWTEQEFARRTAQVQARNEIDPDNEQALPDVLGGFGYNATLPPHPHCPECFGEGLPRVHAEDTRNLKGPAKKLYAGVKQTKSGIEILMQDKGKAMENIARHIGMFIDRHEHTGKNGEPLLKQLTDEQLIAIATGSGARSSS